MQEIDNRTQPLLHPGESRRSNSSSWIAIAIILAAIIVSLAVVQAAYYKSRAAGGAASSELPPSRPAVASSGAGSGPSPNELSTTFRAVTKAVKPAVVFIKIVETTQQPHGFLQIPGFEFPNGGKSKQEASGSGFIVTPDGYILTNNHVVGNADKIEVTLADGKVLRGKRVGTDPDTDLALVKVDATGLPTAVLGDSDAMEQGDWVLAMGSPFGLQQTITAGIVSAKGRPLPGQQLDHFIQTDASINPGNSGGPLVNMEGEVIGINTLIYSPSGSAGNVGIGFAIPSNLARQVYGQLAKSGKVSRGYLGAFVADVDKAKAQGLNVEEKSGVVISDVTSSDSPAAKAGLRAGDVVTAIDGKHVTSASELTDLVVAMPVGHDARVDFIRDGKPETVTVTLTERPTGPISQRLAPGGEEEGGEGGGALTTPKLGIVVETVTPENTPHSNLRIATGAVVKSIEQDGPASEALMQQGDVIHQIGRTQITSASDVAQAVKSLKSGDSVMVSFERKGQMAYVTVNID
jgi:serine protease Do